MLSSSPHELLCRSISIIGLIRFLYDELLRAFVIDYERLYGAKRMRFKLNCFHSFADPCRNLGPLSCWSLFPQESKNCIRHASSTPRSPPTC